MKGTLFSDATMFMMVTEAAATGVHGDGNGAAAIAAKADIVGSNSGRKPTAGRGTICSDQLTIWEGNAAPTAPLRRCPLVH